jgi:MFS family permease
MRLPFYYGWVIVAVTFVTMAIGVNARTAFSLFYPPIIAEFGWERGVTAGAFSFGFVVSGIVSPLIGRLMDRTGPRAVMELGVALMAGGLLLAPLTSQPWHLYVTIGVMVGAGSVCLGYSGQSVWAIMCCTQGSKVIEPMPTPANATPIASPRRRMNQLGRNSDWPE